MSYNINNISILSSISPAPKTCTLAFWPPCKPPCKLSLCSLRKSSMKLEDCGIPLSERFAFYDQVAGYFGCWKDGASSPTKLKNTHSISQPCLKFKSLQDDLHIPITIDHPILDATVQIRTFGENEAEVGCVGRRFS